MSSPPFAYHEPKPGTLSLSGELTLASAEDLKQILLDAIERNPTLDVDLLNVTLIDTAGVQLLLMLDREAARLDKKLGWLGCSLAVEETLELLDLFSVIGHPAAVVWG